MSFLKQFGIPLLLITLVLVAIALMFLGTVLFVLSIVEQSGSVTPMLFGREQMVDFIIFFSGVGLLILVKYIK